MKSWTNPPRNIRKLGWELAARYIQALPVDGFHLDSSYIHKKLALLQVVKRFTGGGIDVGQVKNDIYVVYTEGPVQRVVGFIMLPREVRGYCS